MARAATIPSGVAVVACEPSSPAGWSERPYKNASADVSSPQDLHKGSEEALREEIAYRLWEWLPDVTEVAVFRNLADLLNRNRQ